MQPKGLLEGKRPGVPALALALSPSLRRLFTGENAKCHRAASMRLKCLASGREESDEGYQIVGEGSQTRCGLGIPYLTRMRGSDGDSKYLDATNFDPHQRVI